ncbi:MAG: cell surface protein SprA, partial [Pyrinomonadaceae bacterium]|nr:cell surface protein SprA [Sphingobacteriaceae bacterium]
ALNIEFIEMWVLDPFINKPNSQGGDLYFNLGSISEDILKDGRKSLENGLPGDNDASKTDQTIWGRIPKLQPVIQAFDNDPAARKFQDVGLDGLASADERQSFAAFLNQVKPQLNGDAASALESDPSSDDFQYYRGNNLDNSDAGILKRYERYNGTEGNSKTNEQSLDETGIDNSASTSLPDGEDINRDNNSSLADEYFQYKVSVRPQDMAIGQNFITDKVVSTVKLPNGLSQQVAWYQFKIPIAQYQQKIGNIQDFKSIRFVRMFMTNFADTAILRMARLQLVRGEWRRYNAENSPAKILADPALGTSPGLDNSRIDVSTVNIEENGKRTPIPYVVPPGIERERDFSNFRGDTRQNEQSLSLNVKNLRDGYARSTYRTTYNDFRSYRRIEMFVHAEGDQLKDKDVNAFLRIGTDNQDNYYEYEVPLKITVPGSKDPSAIWPDANTFDIELRKFQAAKAARNNAVEKGLHAGNNIPFIYKDGENFITVVGQPDMSKVRIYMLGVKNPLRSSNTQNMDDGLDKNTEIWFNELRLTDFDERGGWAATVRMNTKLADFGDVTISGSTSSIGFGSIDKKVSERNRKQDNFLDVSSSFELGKFFPARSGIKIPVFINFSNQLSTPQYDPRSQDIELKTALKDLSKGDQKAVNAIVNDNTRRHSINLTNVRKIKTNPNSKSRLWDIENLSATYAYTEYDHRDFITERALQKTYRAGLQYNYTGESKSFTPFNKIIKSNMFALLRDINFSPIPSALNFRIDADRLYSESTLRDNEAAFSLPGQSLIATNFNKNFQMSRLYGVTWNLTKSLQLDFSATNYSVIDEPEGRLTGAKRDTVWQNLKKLGRNTDYNHSLNLNYTVPINKIPALSWTSLVAGYRTNFNWKTEPLATLTDPNIEFGNTIQNARTIQLNPTLNFTSLYNKFKFIRKSNDPNNKSGGKFLIDALTSLKNISGGYTRTEGTFLPGYRPRTELLGYDMDANAPGWDFLFGAQHDIRGRAINNGWITRDTLLNQLYVNTRKEDLTLRGTLEPIRDLRIELSALKSESFNYSTNFKFSNALNSFENQSPITTGDFSISYFALRTAFSKENKDGGSNLFRQFEANRAIISKKLGSSNPNSSGVTDGYSDGYGKNSQDVVVASFLAAYTGKDASKVRLNGFPKIPLPNWRLTYNGLTKYAFFSDLFASFDINHTYRSTYNINSFNSLVRYSEVKGFSNAKDVNGNFLPSFQFSQVTLTEQFLPLIGIDFRLKNNMSANFEYRKSRALSLSLANSQLAQLRDDG